VLLLILNGAPVILGGICLACIGWAFTFGVSWGNFWLKIALSTAVLCLYSFIWQRPRWGFRLGSLVAGITSAAVLYGIFLGGNALARYVIPEAHSQVNGIYALGIGTSKLLIFLLLFFVTSPAEEIFWRGFLQENMMKKWGRYPGFVAATLIYGGVHIFSLNLVLILAALVVGFFWGALYVWKRDVVLLIISHSLWSSVIFAIAPVSG
jgi:membrane protease YdiL (CAAX protease family)